VTVSRDAAIEPGIFADGKPDPRYAHELGLVAAPRGRRSLAFAFDAILWLAIASIGIFGTLPLWKDLRPDADALSAIVQNDAFGTAIIFYLVSQGLLTVLALVQLIMHGIRGVTFGKMIFKLRTVRVTTFAKPGFWRIVARAIVMYLAAVVVPFAGAVVFLLSPLWDPQRRGRGWHDRFVGAWMIDTKNGLDPTDAKALRLARKAVGAAPIADLAPLPSLATRAGHASDVDFVPSARSSSGVIAAHASREPGTPLAPLDPWEAPVIGAATSASGAAESTRESTSVAAAPAPHMPAAPVRPSSATPPVQQAPAASGAHQGRAAPTFAAELRFDDGVRVPIHGAGLLGRNPDPRPGEHIEHLIPVADATLQISKTHAGFGFDERGFWVSDRNSSNGTTVIPPMGEPVELVAGQRLHLAPGTAVLVGGRRFTVELTSSSS
jgi:RDD family/FHA domain